MTALIQAHTTAHANPFAASRERFEQLVTELTSPETLATTHSAIEALLHTQGMALLCQMFQDQLDLLAARERPQVVVGAEGLARDRRRERDRALETRFGRVRLSRLSYEGEGVTSLRPLDAQLNLPVELYSYGVRRLAAEQASSVSFEAAQATIDSVSGAHVPKRQLEAIVARAAEDFDAFYDLRAGAGPSAAAQTGSLVVLGADAKGVVMIREGLRPETRKAAEASARKRGRRLGPGEKLNGKRMAQVASVHTAAPFVRTPEEVMHELLGAPRLARTRPKAERKRVWASLEKEAGEVISAMFEEARTRDPDRQKAYVAVVDGNAHQLRSIEAEAEARKIEVRIVLDLIHVIEYLWRAAWVFHEKGKEGAVAAEGWVSARVLEVLRGRSSAVAGGIRRSATLRQIAPAQRAAADTCANYLIDYGAYLRYDEYLAAGYPIASGVIEGACRHLVQDRMDITGARWSLGEAEAVLKLRSLRSSGDFDAYWGFHERRLYERQHAAFYANSTVPVAEPTPRPGTRSALRVVK